MIRLYIVYLISVFSISYGFPQQLDNLKPAATAETQEEAVWQLIKRTIPKQATKFSVEVSPEIGLGDKDAFHIEKLSNGIVHITGTTGVAVATGFNHYLKYFCNCHISWETDNLNLPEILPDANITISLNDRFRYYQNVCTTSYSFVWWNYKQWEKHIDWMAMNSFNLVLAFNGLESVWTKVYQSMNLTMQEIDEHFSGPAFLSWNRMGNIRGWGGSVSEFWNRRSVVLQQLILKQMRDIGIMSVLPAFNGYVPRAFTRLFPRAKINTTSVWNRFEDEYCCPYLLDPTDALFKIVGKKFMDQLISTFGTDHAYSSDTFNELLPVSGELEYIREMGRSVYAAMEEADPKAVWVMQNWLFVHDFLFWNAERSKALLTSVEPGKMLVLDLQSEQYPQYGRLNSYYGQPYIWCMLHNFGGTLGMFGSVEIINEEIFEARKLPNTTLVGIGLTPEGINQNYVIYDLMTEMAWRTEPTNLTTWFSNYVRRRYGKSDANAIAAWQIFKNTVYSFKEKVKMRGKYAVNQRPRLRIVLWKWYNYFDFFNGWDLLLQSADSLKDSESYRYDVVDTTRQFLQLLGDEYYKELTAAFKLKDTNRFESAASLFLCLFGDLEMILASNKHFLLGIWLNASRTAAFTKEDQSLFEFNARNQITLWGPNGEIVDYANKQWSGVVSHYFFPRWRIFIRRLNESLVHNTVFNESETALEMFNYVEKPFTFDNKIFPIYTKGDTIQIARQIHSKWWNKVHVKEIYTPDDDITVHVV